MREKNDKSDTEDRCLYQCPYEEACMCSMEEPCNGCETWAKALRRKEIKWRKI